MIIMSSKSRHRGRAGYRAKARRQGGTLSVLDFTAFLNVGRGTARGGSKSKKRDFLDLSTKRYYRRERVHHR